MRYRLFGHSGLRVSELSLGTMTFGRDDWGASREESKRIFDAYAERGGNFIDTANRYTDGVAERYVGEFIKSDRDHFVVATKYAMVTRKNDPNASGTQRKNMVRALEASLGRLDTDYVDVYWLHAWDYVTPVDEVMRAFDDLVRAGKILYAGISDTPAWIVSQANTLATFRGWTPFAGLQIEYSLIERTVERDLIPMARAFDLAVAAWAPLGGGVLSGKYATPGDGGQSDGRRLQDGSARLSDRNRAIAAAVTAVARALGRPPSQVAIAWLLQRPGTVIPIVGARYASQITETLDAADLTLGPEHLQQLDDASRIELGFPQAWSRQGYVRELVYGDTLDALKDRRQIPE